MVAANFKKSLSFVLQDEGGNDDDPLDHGGRTSRGITQREYSAWLNEQHRSDGDVWNAPDDDIEAIYYEEYWEPNCDKLPSGLDYLYFDMAVNAGPNRATVILQQSLGVNDDGRIGPVTRQAILATDPFLVVKYYTSKKRQFYLSLHQPRFIRGWLNRCTDVQANAITMIGP